MAVTGLGLGPLMDDEISSMLANSARGFLDANHDMGRRVRILRGDAAGFDRALWQEMAALGWLAVRVPEDRGGAGLEPHHAVLLARIFGGALLNEPFVAAGLLPAACLTFVSRIGIVDDLLAQLVSGEAVFTLAWQEHAGQMDLGHASLALSQEPESLTATGEKCFVPFATGVDRFLITGRLEGEFALADIAAESNGLQVLPGTVVDGAPSGTLKLNHAPARLLAKGEAAAQGVRRAGLEATLALAAELVGISSAALDMTAEFMRQRVQFGKPIGSFQALQHRLVDFYNQIRLSDASVRAAAQALAQNTDAAEIAVSAAKARAGETAQLVTAGAIQLHGAIGYTDEYDIGLYLKAALRRMSWLGNAKRHRVRAMELLRPISVDHL